MKILKQRQTSNKNIKKWYLIFTEFANFFFNIKSAVYLFSGSSVEEFKINVYSLKTSLRRITWPICLTLFKSNWTCRIICIIEFLKLGSSAFCELHFPFTCQVVRSVNCLKFYTSSQRVWRQETTKLELFQLAFCLKSLFNYRKLDLRAEIYRLPAILSRNESFLAVTFWRLAN